MAKYLRGSFSTFAPNSTEYTMTSNIRTQNDYYERINLVLQHINSNLDEPLDLERLAGISCYSPFHLHRIIRAYLGEPLGAYIVRARLALASNLLRYSGEPIGSIALRVGYDTPASFCKAFRKRFGVSPSVFRSDPSVSIPFEHFKPQTNTAMDGLTKETRMEQLKEMSVIYVSAMGPYHKGAEDAWGYLCEFAGRNLLIDGSSQFFGISYDDPKTTEPSRLRYEACITVEKPIKPEGRVGVKDIGGGNYAVFTLQGPFDKLSGAYDYIYGQWLKESKAKLRDTPCMERYVNSPGEVAPEDQVTEIYIPV